MQRNQLVNYLDTYLRIAEIKDYGIQGLQIEGHAEINKIVGAVDSHQPVIKAALARGADLLLVHHGIFWGKERPLVGHFGQLVRTCFGAELNLYAAHLPLDAHPEVGNNAELARLLGLSVTNSFAKINGTLLAVMAEPLAPITFEELVLRFTQAIGQPTLIQQHGSPLCRHIGILSGFGAKEIEEAAALGCDAFITGETSHAQYYDAQNAGINVIYGGHYATETVGVKALGRHLQEKFNLTFEFIDLPTGL